MELPLSTLAIVIIVVFMIFLGIYLFMKIRESGTEALNQILNIPDFLKKIFGGTG